MHVLKSNNIFDEINFMFCFLVEIVDFVAQRNCWWWLHSNLIMCKQGWGARDWFLIWRQPNNERNHSISKCCNKLPREGKGYYFYVAKKSNSLFECLFGLVVCISIQVSYPNLFWVYFKSTIKMLQNKNKSYLIIILCQKCTRKLFQRDKLSSILILKIIPT